MKLLPRKVLFFSFLSFSALALPAAVFADTVKTALGDISTDPNQLVTTILRIAMGMAGGVAFLLIVYGGFRLALSSGDPKAIQEGRDIITSAIVGLLIIIFAVFILRVIGIDILGLPINK